MRERARKDKGLRSDTTDGVQLLVPGFFLGVKIDLIGTKIFWLSKVCGFQPETPVSAYQVAADNPGQIPKGNGFRGNPLPSHNDEGKGSLTIGTFYVIPVGDPWFGQMNRKGKFKGSNNKNRFVKQTSKAQTTSKVHQQRRLFVMCNRGMRRRWVVETSI
ncbi:hypothetical protein [Planifilum fimeticola]